MPQNVLLGRQHHIAFNEGMVWAEGERHGCFNEEKVRSDGLTLKACGRENMDISGDAYAAWCVRPF